MITSVGIGITTGVFGEVIQGGAPPPPLGNFIALESGLSDIMALESGLTDKVELE